MFVNYSLILEMNLASHFLWAYILVSQGKNIFPKFICISLNVFSFLIKIRILSQ